MRGTLLLLRKSHGAGCGKAVAVDPGNTHQERRRLSVPNSPEEDSGVGSYSSRSSQDLGHPWPGPPLSASQNGQRKAGDQGGSRGWRVARASFLPPRPRRWRVCRAGNRSRLPSARDTTEVGEERGSLASQPLPHPCYLAAIGSALFSPQGKRLRHTPARSSPGGGPMSLGVWCGGSFHCYSANSEA